MTTDRTVATERLLLRPISPEDAEAMAAVYAHPDVARFLGDLRDLGLEQTRAQLTRWAEEWTARGIGTFAVLDGANGEFLGRAGVKYWPEFDFTEVGWVLRRDAWGRGYATEAGAASLDFAFANSELECVTAIIAPGNRASVAVAERLGMQPWRDDVVYGMAVTIYAADRPVG